MARILIVEDQPAVATALAVLFEIEGLQCRVVDGPEAALAALGEESFGVVLQDMNFTPGATAGEEGIQLFRRIRRLDPRLPVLLLTAWTSLPTAVQLVKEGAADYMAKPWDDEKLLAAVHHLLRGRELELAAGPSPGGIQEARAELARRFDLRGTVYASAAMHRLVTLALKAAPSEVPVLITGPSGVGKEKLAEIVQANSDRRTRPFLRVNAGALPEELLEAELFGAEAGAYTGARGRRTGRFEAADGGTLFLDEIGNLPLPGQAKLLRVLQSGELQRLGSSATRRVDVRILCATNADLEAAIAAGRFREDLYFRLNVVELAVPPLARRPEDVLPLAEHFLARLPPSPAGRAWELEAAAAERLRRHPWPGNVRELENALQRASLLAAGGTLRAADLELPAGQPGEEAGGSDPGGLAAAGPEESAGAADERLRIQHALSEAGGVVSRAAELLGLSRQALYRRMEKYGITLERRVKG